MQDRYAGDVGDFMTLGLLRFLADDGRVPAWRLGIIWYLVADESHNGDGMHISYLEPDNAIGTRLRAIDPELHDRMRRVVKDGPRTVGRLERLGGVPQGTLMFAERLAPGPGRAAWVGRAHASVNEADLVFVAPDNGVRSADHPTPRTRRLSIKFAYLDELAPIVDRGKSLIVYQHTDRGGTVEQQIVRRAEQLHDGLGIRPLAAVRASRGSARLFFVVPAPTHAERLRERVQAISESPWAAELRVAWTDQNAR